MKIILWGIPILVIATIVMGYFFLSENKETQVCFSSHCFNAEIADSLKTQKVGLMFRKTLKKDEGMMFIFPEENIYTFWMKNTLIPLDIIWMDQNKEVVFISENNQPCQSDPCPSIDPEVKAKYVLEINAGLSKEIGLSVGDKLEFN